MDQREVLHRLGVTDADIQGCLQAPTIALARLRLEQMQSVARRRYHAVALDLHPDLTGDDEPKMRELQGIAEVYDTVMALKIHHVRPEYTVAHGPGVSVCFEASPETIDLKDRCRSGQ